MISKNPEITGMVFNKITLAFPEKNEVVFLEKYFSDSIVQIRFGVLSGIILYAAFGFLDLQIIPEYAKLFLIIRFYIVIPLGLAVLLLSFTKIFRKVWQLLLFICIVVSGVGINIMTMLVPYNYSYYAGIMLVFSAGYFLFKVRFFHATIACWTVLLLFNLGAVFYAHDSSLILISYNFFFISANVIGMVAAYNIEYFVRRDYYMNRELDHQKAAVEDINKNLEKIVEERTIELIEAKDEAEQHDKLKSAFLANMSHEIRTPMNGILGFAELLKRPNLSGEEHQKYINIIEKSGARMLNIINDIVDISKIESGLMDVDIQESNINEQIQYIYTFFKPEVEAKGMQLLIKNSLPSNEAFVKTDREKIYAILTNLVKNAIKYSDDGSIEFGYTIIEKAQVLSLQFFVKDTGIGIPKDRQDAIFERFIQADIYDKKALQGAGLGLAITKAYVEMLGGKIWVESKQGKGSVFYFTIPYSNGIYVKNLIKDNDSPDNREVLIKNLKILVAEDDENSALYIKKVIEKLSRQILHTRTGVETIEACRNEPDIDLILMDIQMPVMNGYEATRQIRQFNKEVIIIAQTAYALTGEKEKAIDAGCDDYISKPIKQDLLLALIEKYFSK